MEIVEGNVPLPVAAKVLGISVPSVTGGLIAGALPIGSAWKNEEGNDKNMYHISPKKLADYEGYSKEEILELIDRHKKGAL